MGGAGTVAPNSTSSPKPDERPQDSAEPGRERPSGPAGEGRRPGRWVHAGRLVHVAGIFTRYGFYSLLWRLGLGAWLPAMRMGQRPPRLAMPEAVAARRALEEAGGAWVKLGQALASRADVLPSDFVDEGRKLQDAVPPVSFAEVREVVEAELGRPLEEAFAAFEEQPAASASIAQIHFARLHSGEEVAVKVQRPAVKEIIERDLTVAQFIARQASNRFAWCARRRIGEVVAELAGSLRAELDFRREARNTEALRANLADVPGVKVPRVYPELSTGRVLTLERITGRKVFEREALLALGVDRAAVAHNLARATLRMMLVEGAFHADPHPGNILITGDGTAVLLDCGNVWYVMPSLRRELVILLLALLQADPDEVTDQLLQIGLVGSTVDVAELRADVERQLSRFHALRSSEIPLGEALEELLALIARHEMVVPSVLAMLLKALMVTEGACLELDPSFDFRQAAGELLRQTPGLLFRPKELVLDALRLGRELRRYVGLLPRQVSAVLRRADAGTLRVRVQLDEFEGPMHRLDVMFNRLAWSIVVAAMILAAAIWLQTQAVSLPLQQTAVFVMLMGVLAGLWLLYSIVRSGRM